MYFIVFSYNRSLNSFVLNYNTYRYSIYAIQITFKHVRCFYIIDCIKRSVFDLEESVLSLSKILSLFL